MSSVVLWDVPEGKLIATLEAEAMVPGTLTFSADGLWLAVGSNIYDAKTGDWIRQWRPPGSIVFSVSFSPDGKLAANTSREGDVALWDATSDSLQGHLLRVFHAHDHVVPPANAKPIQARYNELLRGLAFSPDSKTLASGDDSGIIKLRDLRTGALSRMLTDHTESISALAFVDDATLASSSFDGSIKLWDSHTGKLRATLLALPAAAPAGSLVEWLAYTPEGDYTGSPGCERFIRWQVGSRFLPAAAYGQNFHRPDRVRLALATRTPYPAPVVPAVVSTPGVPNSVPGVQPPAVPSGIEAPRIVGVPAAGPEGPQLVVQKGHSQDIEGIEFSPDGTMMASRSEDLMGQSEEEAIWLWDTRTWDLENKVNVQGGMITGMVFIPGSKLLASSSTDGKVRIWEVPSGRLAQSFSAGSGMITALAVGPDGKTIATGGDGVVRVWDRTTGRLQRTMAGLPGAVRSLSLSESGKLLATWDKGAQVWDVSTGKLIHAFGPIGRAAFVPGRPPGAGEWIASAIGPVLDLQGNPVRTLAGIIPQYSFDTTLISLQHNGKRLLSGNDNGEMTLCDLDTGTVVRKFKEPYSGTTAAALSPDGKIAVQGWQNGDLKVWDTVTGKLLRTLNGFIGGINSIALSSDGARLVSGGDDGVVRWWDLTKGALINTQAGVGREIESVALSSDGTLLAACARNGLTTWDVASEKQLTRIANGIHSTKVAFRPGSSQVGDGAPQPSLWDVRTGQRVRIFGSPDPRGPVGGGNASFSADGKTFAVTGDQDVALWNAETGQLRQRLHGFAGGADVVTFSSSGKYLAGGTLDGGGNAVEVWDLHTGSLLRRLMGHKGWLRSVAVSPDEKWIASGSMDNTARLWDLQTGRPVLTLVGYENWVNGVVFTPDSRRLITAGNDNTLKVWDVPSGRLLLTIAILPSGSNAQPVYDWIAYTPDGYYTGSPGIAALIRWRVGDQILLASAYEQTFHRPDKVAEALQPPRA